MDLVEMFEGDVPKEIRRRLQSSARSGNYYFIVPEAGWGLNNAHYVPLFRVFSTKYYRIGIRFRLLRELRIMEIRKGMQLPVPSGRWEEVREFIETFEDPVLLAIGEYAVSPDDIYDQLSRFREFFLFEKSKTEEDWRQRHEAMKAAKAAIDWGNEVGVQGNLSWKYGRKREGSLIHQLLEEKDGAILFNHEMAFRHWVLKGVQCNNEVLLLNDNQEHTRINIYSYDHNKESCVLGPNEAILFTHPFPRPDEGVD